MELPLSVREYFASRNSFDTESALAQLDDDGVVVDEDLEYLAAIRNVCAVTVFADADRDYVLSRGFGLAL